MEITISRRYLKIPVSYSGEVYHFKLSAGEGAEYSFDAAYAEKAADTVYYADLREFLGQTVSITIDPPVLLKPEYCDQPEPVKEDPMRPMAHFSAPRGWMNDPNGLCCYEGTYHLFYQHNPYGRTWGNMHWGHAVSKDLFHWEHCQEALLSDGDGVIFSGSALIDYRNASGLKKGQNAPILFYYTRVGKTHDQCLAVSTDGGLTLTKYERPVLPAMTSENRDPKVIFDQARSRYLMALYMEESRYALFVSENLLDWRLLQEIELPGDNECPDIYPLRAEDGREYWILSGAHDKYYVGIFDEEGYYSPVQEIGQLSYDSEGYAAQTYFYEKEKPVIRFTWDRSNIPGTPYNGSMCFPMEMGLVKRDGTFYLTARPVSYEAGLVKKKTAFRQTGSLRVPLLRRAYEIEIHAGEAAYEINLFGLRMQGDQTGVRCKDKFLPRIGKDHTLRIISDTVSTELYLNDVAVTSVAHLSDYAEGEFTACSEGKLQKVCIKELGL